MMVFCTQPVSMAAGASQIEHLPGSSQICLGLDIAMLHCTHLP